MREVAQGLAEALGFALVDEEIIVHAAAEGGVDPDVVADVERRRSFLERAMTNFAAGSDLSAYSYSGVGGGTRGHLDSAVGPGEQGLRGLIQTAIEESADRGDVVIVAHAASHALAARADVLRVLVTASDTTRRERVASAQELSEKDAARAVEQSDTARSDYLKRFYGEKSELSTHYDVVVNTDRLVPAEAVSLIVTAAGR
jgi:hypothetical protein